MEGEISKSMGVNTRPSYKFEINGYWLMLDPNADEATVEQVKDLIIKSKRVKDGEQDCDTCKHFDVLGGEEPCSNCLVINYNHITAKNNWEAKQ